MNRTLRLVGMAAMVLLLAASCKKEEKENGEKQMMTFSAGIAQNGNAKTGLIPEGDASTSNGHYFKQHWLPTDKINVNGSTFSIIESTIDNGDATSTASFEGLIVPTTTDYYAVYPVSDNAKLNVNDKTATFTIPSVQEVVRTETSKGVMYEPAFAPMAAQCATGAEQLAFDNLCGLLELRVYCPEDLDLTVTKIAVTTTSGADIAGEWKYDFSNKTFSKTSAEGHSNRITMSFNNNIQVSKDADNPTSFLFVIPPVTTDVDNFNVYVYGNDSGDYEYVTLTRITANPQILNITGGSVLYNMTPIELKPVINPACKSIKNHQDAPSLAPVNGFYCEGIIERVNNTVGVEISETGFCYVENSNGSESPAFPDYSFEIGASNPNYIKIGNTDANFYGQITGLTANKKYAVVAYAIYSYKGNEGKHVARSSKSQTLAVMN